mgnify:CR=1 FL=1
MEFDLFDLSTRDYYVKNGNNSILSILKIDAEIVEK